MEICHAHNLPKPVPAAKPYGIRVSMRSGDTFARLLGTDWSREHWFETAAERDRNLDDMAREHLYSRRGDRPTLRFEAIEKTG